MSRHADSSYSDTEERPSVLALVGVIAVGLLAVIIAVKLVGWLLGLAVPVAVLAVGLALVSNGRRPGGSSMALLAGWATAIIGGLWLLARLL